LTWIQKWLKSLLRPKINLRNPEVIGRAIIKKDKKSGAKYWLTTDSNWLDRDELPFNEPLSISVRLFKAGTTIEIVGEIEENIKIEKKQK